MTPGSGELYSYTITIHMVVMVTMYFMLYRRTSNDNSDKIIGHSEQGTVRGMMHTHVI